MDLNLGKRALCVFSSMIITHSIMDRSNFASLDAEVANDISGTECEPRLVRVLTGKCGAGVVFVIKIGNLYFDMWKKPLELATTCSLRRHSNSEESPTVIQKLAKISSELVKSSLNSDSRFTSHLYVVNLYNKKNYLVYQNLYENGGHHALYPNICTEKRYDQFYDHFYSYYSFTEHSVRGTKCAVFYLCQQKAQSEKNAAG